MADEVKNTGSAKKTAKKSKKSWFKGLKAEFKKITWTEKRTLGRQTVAVVAISAVVCVIITLIDSLGLRLIELIIK